MTANRASGHIVAMGGGGFSMETDSPLDAFILELTGAARPKVCFVPTPAGDDPAFVRKFHETLGQRCLPSVATTFFPAERPIEDLLAEADVIYVPGGNTVNTLAVWRAQGLDQLLSEAWERGAVLCGLSAGSICWFESGLTDSLATSRGLAPFTAGLGLLPGSHCPHYDTEPLRRPAYHEMVAAGLLSAGYAADEFAALHFVGTELLEVVVSRVGPGAYRVEPDGEAAAEHRLDARLLR